MPTEDRIPREVRVSLFFSGKIAITVDFLHVLYSYRIDRSNPDFNFVGSHFFLLGRLGVQKTDLSCVCVCVCSSRFPSENDDVPVSEPTFFLRIQR